MLKILSLVGICVFFFFILNRLFTDSPITVNNDYNSLSKTTYTVSSPSPYPVVDAVPYLADDFTKRQFDPKSKFVIGLGKDATPSADFPLELVAVPDHQLQSLRCTDEINFYKDTYSFTDSANGKSFRLESIDPVYQNVLSVINSELENDEVIWFFNYCLDEKGEVVIHYYKTGKDLNKKIALPDNFLFTDINGKTKKVSLNIGPFQYFTCRKPLQFTINKILYFKCGGGDTIMYDSIYKIDFNNQIGDRLLECSQSEGDANTLPNPPLICK